MTLWAALLIVTFAQTKPLAQSLTGEARTYYDAGVALYRKRDFTAALAQFRSAHKADSDPRLLWNMAVCEKNLQHHAAARALTTRYLADAKLSDAERTEATEFAASLKALVADVTVESTPPGATVFVDDEERGKTPLSIAVDMGPRTFRLVLPGFIEARRSERLEGGTTPLVRVTLAREDAKLSLTGKVGHVVVIHGQTVGRTPWSGPIAPGAHVIEVSNKGYKPRRIELRVASGETRTADVALEPEPVRWPWIAGGVVAAIAVGVGGYLLLRPGDPPPPQSGTLGGYQLP